MLQLEKQSMSQIFEKPVSSMGPLIYDKKEKSIRI